MSKQKGNTVLIVIIVVLAIIALAGIMTAVYFWGKSKGNVAPTTSPATTKSATPATKTSVTTTPTKVTATSQTEESAKQAVENFMKYTLGTIPGAEINYDKAYAYLSDNMRAQYPGDNWVQELYKIQDGPSSVKFISESQFEGGVILRYDPTWGDMSLAWSFTVELIDNQWFITGFSNTAQ